MKSYFAVLILSSLFINSCQRDDLTPSWVVINSIELETNEATEGPNSNGITDAWIFMDNTPLGVFSLPAKIPILAEGNHDFIIYAGIKENGISATRVKYPFYERFETSLTLVKGEEIIMSPVVKYKSNVQFELKEDFEDIGIDFEKDNISDTTIVIITAAANPGIVAYGNNCGLISLSSADSVYKGITNTNLNLPRNEDVYLEIDYMNDNSIAMGVIAENSTGISEHTPLVLMHPQEPNELIWKKIYINLKDDVSSEINATSYEIYLLSILDASNSSAVIYLDNIKVVRYQ